MPIQWNKVTWYSKLLAVILGALIFIVAFCLGKQAGRLESYNEQTPTVLHFEAGDSVTKEEEKEPSILGSWQRIGLENQVVTYKEDGSADVLYGGVLNTTFHWDISVAEDGTRTIREDGNPDRFYKILKLDENTLEIEYQYNKAVLRYNRIKN